MKKLSACLFVTLSAAVASSPLSAAEPGSTFGLTPAAKQETLLPEGQGGLPLIPEGIPPLEESAGKKDNKEKKSKTSAAEDALRDRIKLRTALTKAKNDPELQAIWDSSFKAKTDFEQRAIYDKYYTLLCERLLKIDKSLKKEDVQAMKNAYLSNYDQTRIAPTVPPEVARPRPSTGTR